MVCYLFSCFVTAFLIVNMNVIVVLGWCQFWWVSWCYFKLNCSVLISRFDIITFRFTNPYGCELLVILFGMCERLICMCQVIYSATVDIVMTRHCFWMWWDIDSNRSCPTNLLCWYCFLWYAVRSLGFVFCSLMDWVICPLN